MNKTLVCPWFRLSGESLAYLFLEFLDSCPFKFIILKDSNYFYYIDYILLIYPWKNGLKITDRLNNIEFIIDFTYKLKTNNTLCFLDI